MWKCVLVSIIFRIFVRYNNMRMRLQISEGNPYQYIDGLFEVANEQSANLLQLWADTKGFCEVSHDEACGMGFSELAEWSKPETDLLYCIDDVVCICLNKDSIVE